MIPSPVASFGLARRGRLFQPAKPQLRGRQDQHFLAAEEDEKHGRVLSRHTFDRRRGFAGDHAIASQIRVQPQFIEPLFGPR